MIEIPDAIDAKTIALVSQTGNVMKTTIAAALGLTLAKAGLDVLAVDLDPEHHARGASLATWLNDRRAKHPERPQLNVIAPKTARDALEAIYRPMLDIAIVDCPSRATEASFVVAADADYTILPLAPGEKDWTLTLSTIQQMMEIGIRPERLAIIMTRTGSIAEAKNYIDWLHAANLGAINIIAQHIPEKVAYRDAITRKLAITETPSLSVRVQARRAIDALIEGFEKATNPAPIAHLEGVA